MFRPPPRPTLFPYTTLFRSLSRKQGGGARRRLVPPGARRVACACRSERVRQVDHRQAVAALLRAGLGADPPRWADRKSTRLNSSHRCISYAVFCLKKKNLSQQQIAADPSPLPPYHRAPNTGLPHAGEAPDSHQRRLSYSLLSCQRSTYSVHSTRLL